MVYRKYRHILLKLHLYTLLEIFGICYNVKKVWALKRYYDYGISNSNTSYDISNSNTLQLVGNDYIAATTIYSAARGF